MKTRYIIKPYGKVGILIPFRYKGNWHYSNASGSIFRFKGIIGGTNICDYIRMEIKDHELVGVLVKDKKI